MVDAHEVEGLPLPVVVSEHCPPDTAYVMDPSVVGVELDGHGAAIVVQRREVAEGLQCEDVLDAMRRIGDLVPRAPEADR